MTVVMYCIGAVITDAVRFAVMPIVAQLSGSDVQDIYTTRVSTYPELIAFECEGMDIESRQLLLVRITDKALLGRQETHKTTVVTGHPDRSFTILTETRDDIARESILLSVGHEAVTNRREIVHTAIERAYP